MIGKTVSHYKILEKIGEGGMGVVYKAEDTKLDRLVALKFLPQQFSINEEEKSRFILEAKAAAALDHTNICAVHEIDETTDGQMFIAMAYYEGVTLKDSIKKGPLQIEESLKIAIQVSEGLYEAHEKGIVHRDIKSANIIITDKGIAKILDFGLAKLKGQSKLTKVGTTVGTAAYMSPEQANGTEVDHRTDIWSLGVVLYEMLTGKLPFKGDYEQAVIYSILNEEPEPVSTHRTDVQVELEKIINKMLIKDPAGRYQATDHLLEDLRKVKEDTAPELSVSKIDSRSGISSKISRRSIIAASLFLSVILILLFIQWQSQLDKDKSKVVKDPDGRISITVLPFVNLTGDTLFSDWQAGVQNLLINSLSNSKEISVRQPETMSNILSGKGKINYASTTPSFASEIAQKLETNTYIIGNILKAGNKIRISVQLRDASTQETYRSFEVNGDSEDQIFMMADSLSSLIMNFLQIKVLEKDVYFHAKMHSETHSAEAYRYYIQGLKISYSSEYAEAIKLYHKALDRDSCFVSALVWLTISYVNNGQHEQARLIQKRTSRYIDQAPLYEQLFYNFFKAFLDKDLQGRIKYAMRLTEEYPYAIIPYFALGNSYFDIHQYEKASDVFEKLFAGMRQIDFKWPWIVVYDIAGKCYHKLGQHTKEQEVYELGLGVLPDDPEIIYRQAVCTLSQGDTVKASKLIAKFRTISKGEGYTVPHIQNLTGSIYHEANYLDKAQEYYQLAIKSVPGDIHAIKAMNNLAYLLIDNDINISEGMILNDQALKAKPADRALLANIQHVVGWGLYKQGKLRKAYAFLKESWETIPYYDHDHFLHIQEVEQALANQNK